MESREPYFDTRFVGDAAVTVVDEARGRYGVDLTDPQGHPVTDDSLPQGAVVISFGVAHLRLGSASILVDAGLDDPDSAWGRRFSEEWKAHRTPGLAGALAAIGEAPESITHILITHAHFDHVVGLTVTRDGGAAPRYSGARVLLGREDWEGSAERDDPASEIGARLRVIEQHGLLDLIDGDVEVVPGISMLHTPGESPAHHVVRVASGDGAFYALGDLFHFDSEVIHPQWSAPWVDKAAMTASRARILSEVAESGATAIFSHHPFPPWGRVIRDESGFRWVAG